MCMPQRAGNGVPAPHQNVGSLDIVVQSAHVHASSIVRQVLLPWLGQPVASEPDRLPFARNIADTNIAEGSTFTLRSYCPWHRDEMNPPPPLDESTWVLNVNTAFLDSSTLTALFYQRNYVCSYLRASSIQDPMLAHFLSSYQGFNEERRTFSRLLIPDHSFENEPPRTDDTMRRNVWRNTRGDIPANTRVNTGFVRTQANLNPLGFHNLFLACWITGRLFQPELVGKCLGIHCHLVVIKHFGATCYGNTRLAQQTLEAFSRIRIRL
jgi:hypothetical protein